MHLGLSIEADYINAAVLQDGGDFVTQIRQPITDNSAPALLAACVKIVENIQPALGNTVTIGVAVDGGSGQPTPPENNSCINQIDVKANLQACLGRAITIATPAEALGLYESQLGAARDAALSCFLYLDQHVSGSVIFGQRLWRGANRIVGNWGHMPLAWPVAQELEACECWCGRKGCLDTYISLAGLESEYRSITRSHLDIQAIATTADAGDLVASSVLQLLDDRIGRTTASIINMFDPEVIVLGGKLALLDRIYQNVPRKWPGYLLEKRSKTRLIQAAYMNGEQLGIAIAKGAAYFASDDAFNK